MPRSPLAEQNTRETPTPTTPTDSGQVTGDDEFSTLKFICSVMMTSASRVHPMSSWSALGDIQDDDANMATRITTDNSLYDLGDLGQRSFVSRPPCRCSCGCRRRPGRRIQCSICMNLVGPGCCWMIDSDRCHRCLTAEPDPEPDLGIAAYGQKKRTQLHAALDCDE